MTESEGAAATRSLDVSLPVRQPVEATGDSGVPPAQQAFLLQEILNRIPVSLTVQDADGRFIVANAAAAADLGLPADALVGASPADFLAEGEAAQRREWEQSLMQRGRPVTLEANVNDGKGERTLLTSHVPAQIGGQGFLISSAVDITEQRRLQRELTERLHIDDLTGLPDRIRIQRHVEKLIGDGGRSFALAFVDLDNFKHVNDYYNHAVGDQLLIKISERISARLRAGDMLARISGDEFLLVLDPFETEAQLAPIVDAILHDLRKPFYIDGFEVFSSCSIGVSTYPAHGGDYETLRRNADSAMYRAKQASKGNAVFFNDILERAVSARMAAEQRLRLAIRDHRFCCAFQPKVDIYSQDIAGVETLIRWRDGVGEFQTPGEFINLAIELGLIDPITNYVVAQALDAMDRLDAVFGANTDVSINVAAKQANNAEFMRALAETLARSGHAHRIILELTEDAFIAKGEFQTDILPVLRNIGVRVSIDDFGTGYSSLSALADITADEIKIDRSFVSAIHQRPRNQSVLRAIESLGQALGMTIVAEGVETFEELAYLRAATRIRYAQGFYFSRPLYLDDLTRTADASTRVPQAARLQANRPALSTGRSIAPARSSG